MMLAEEELPMAKMKLLALSPASCPSDGLLQGFVSQEQAETASPEK